MVEPKLQPTLIERLRKVESSGILIDVTTCWYRNPDGPEAADALAKMEAALETAKVGFTMIRDDRNGTSKSVRAEVEIKRIDEALAALKEPRS